MSSIDIKDLALVAWGCLGMIMWVVTQLRLTRVEDRVSKRVVKAAEDTKQAAIDSVLGMEKRVDAATMRMETTITAKLDDIEIPEIPEFDSDSIIKEIQSTIDQKMNSVKAVEAKQIKGLLDEMGLEGLAAEKREKIISRMSLRQKAGIRLMTMKVPKAARENNPLAVAVFDEARGIVGEYLVAENEGVVNQVRGGNRSSGGFNPGYNP